MRIARAAFKKVWLPWAFAGLLSILCATLAVVQHRWIDEISAADRNRLQGVLQTRLNRLSADFDRQIAESYSGLRPSFADIVEWGTQVACSRQYVHWQTTSEPVFSHIGMVIMEGEQPQPYMLDMNTGRLERADWPAEWKGMRERFDARSRNALAPALPPSEAALLDFPLFGSLHHAFTETARRGSMVEIPGHDEPLAPPKEDWLVVEVSLGYVRSTLLPALLEKYITGAGMPAYDARIVSAGKPWVKLLDMPEENDKRPKSPDASVDLLQMSNMDIRRGQGEPVFPPAVQQGQGRARWRLLLYHRGYSLEDQVTSVRLRNFALSGGILALILTTVLVLVRYARKSEQLAGLQMNFVAGVSHELRTPLTVIRTAAFNLRGRVAHRPEQVEKYGLLIQNESQKLGVLVEQILRYGAASAGRVIGERHRVDTRRLIENSLKTSLAAPEGGITVERRIDPNLPMIFADELALTHALQNIVDNGVKHGGEGSGWIGVSAAVVEGERRTVEIRVADHGPGIPEHERLHLFDAFFRGERALQDQVHGTGLGLNLVKSIIEAHGGTIQVKSEPGKGAEFILSIPAAAEDLEDVFSNTAG